MRPDIELAADQLRRMRGMNAAYHRRFFSDVRFTMLLVLALFAAGLAIDPALYLAVAPVALIGACQTAFDASYLIFSRHYAAALEGFLNKASGRDVLVAARMEDEYLFPLNDRKIVTIPVAAKRFSWFGFMTLLYTLLGAATFLLGIVLGISAVSLLWGLVYAIVMAALTAAALAAGWWWFVGGEGERRLAEVLSGFAVE